MKILHVDSSILGGNSVSRQLSAAIVDQLKAEYRDVEVTYSDLVANPLPHLTGGYFASLGKTDAERTDTEKAEIAASSKALDDFLAADIVVIGAPMYNFTVSTQLKAWIDRLAVAGKTFKYTADGSVGLAGGKKVYVASSKGGIYARTDLQGLDHVDPYLKTILNFFGITDIEYYSAEGIAISPEQREKSISLTREQIVQIHA